ncbi:MAG TPA: C4-dicarboxylate ABC transporter permease, partial [Clostridiales bacterium]|nr:C4-dicarboxylate ABC transporter permease [Clostridiales bacterium]
FLITATMAAPALIQLGIPAIAAHMFVFYYAMFANLTPPVALASFAAAGVSGGDPMKTGVQSVKLALAGFIVPYMFVYNTALLSIDTTAAITIRVIITSMLGVFMIGAATEGFFIKKMNLFLRVIVFAAALFMISESVYQDFIGLAILIALIIIQKIKKPATTA